jgi:hypothetical protein
MMKIEEKKKRRREEKEIIISTYSHTKCVFSDRKTAVNTKQNFLKKKKNSFLYLMKSRL